MKSIIKFIIATTLMVPMLAYCAPNKFKDGTDYTVIAHSKPQSSAQVVEVVEFFSFGCPWCYRLETSLQQWLEKKPSNVKFTRVPVAFNTQWETYAKAYYIAEALGLSEKLTPAIFKAIQEDRQDLSTEEAMAEFFVKHGVSKKDFTNAYHYSPALDAYLNQGKTLMRNYKIMAVPTIIVAGKYKTEPRMVGGDSDKLMNVVDYLIKHKP